MIHGTILALLAGIALVWWIVKRKPAASPTIIYDGSFADDSPRRRASRAAEVLEAALRPEPPPIPDLQVKKARTRKAIKK
jgi:hypothetical protein